MGQQVPIYNEIRQGKPEQIFHYDFSTFNMLFKFCFRIFLPGHCPVKTVIFIN